MTACVSTQNSVGNFWRICRERKLVWSDRAEATPAKSAERRCRRRTTERQLVGDVDVRGCGCGYAVDTDANRQENREMCEIILISDVDQFVFLRSINLLRLLRPALVLENGRPIFSAIRLYVYYFTRWINH